MATSITKFGVTWEFDADYESGEYCNGDPWVVGPVNIIMITPMSYDNAGRIMNGSMVNPAVSTQQGYDTWMMGGIAHAGYFESGLNDGMPNGTGISGSNPLSVTTGSVCSGISYVVDQGIHNVESIAVLTVVPSAPAVGDFRPSYVGIDKTSPDNISNIDWSLLPDLTPPPLQTQDWIDLHIANAQTRFEKPWVEHIDTWIKELSLPPGNMANYGREISIYVSELASLLVLNIDSAVKQALAIQLIQVGIDNYGITQTTAGKDSWAANGGHMTGRAFPVIFAGAMLGNSDIADVMLLSGEHAYSGVYGAGDLPPDYIHFGMVDQVFTVTQQAVDITHSVDWEPDYRDTAIPYETSDIGLADWGFAHASSPNLDNNNEDSQYRYNGQTTTGQILASLIMGIGTAWNYEVMFDYQDRFMTFDVAYNDFLQQMWDTYRADYPYIPIPSEPIYIAYTI